MNRQILYDRDISILLYKEPETVKKSYTVIREKDYGTSKVQRAGGPRNPYRIYGESASEGEYDTHPAKLEFWPGDYRLQYESKIKQIKSRNAPSVDYGQMVYMDRNGRGQVTYRYNKQTEHVKRIWARGASYTFNTREEMLRGTRPDGTPFSTGDKVRIIEDGSRWNVYAEGSLATNVVEENIEQPAQALEIKSTDYGLKPDITMSINLLPNQNCYGATVRIKNLNCPIDIRTWDKMIITAGYRTGKKVVYNCPIFSSYIESPNPDGVTVFEGLTVGVAEDVLTDKYIVIEFIQEEITLERLVRDVAKGISENIVVTLALSEEYTQCMLKVTKQQVFAQNGMAILNWLQNFISDFIAKKTDNETTVLVQLVDGELSVIAINGKNKEPRTYESIINLDMVTGASFSGTALTVVAPWNPALRPGDLFYLPPSFINGSKLPNSISPNEYRNPENLYRALTIGVEFASVDKQNKMTVLASPAQWAGRLPDNKTTEMPADVYGQIITEKYQHQGEPVYVGDPETLPASESVTAEQKEETGVQFFDQSNNILAQWDTWTSITQSEITGSCISSIARYYLYNMQGGPLLKEGMGNTRERSYYESVKELTNMGLTLAVDHFQGTGISAQYLWWPLITAATYWRRKNDIRAGVNHNWTKIYPNNPNFIEANKAVYIPVFPEGWRSSRSKLIAVRDIWRDAYISFKELYGDSCKIWRAMYYYLGGTNTDGLD